MTNRNKPTKDTPMETNKNKGPQSIIAKLGGTHVLSEALKLDNSTVFKWKQNNFIPVKQWDAIIKLLKVNNKRFSMSDFYKIKK